MEVTGPAVTSEAHLQCSAGEHVLEYVLILSVRARFSLSNLGEQTETGPKAAAGKQHRSMVILVSKSVRTAGYMLPPQD